VATPRKRYAIIECSLLREDWSDAAKLACVRLLLLMAERSAADLLSPEQACHIRLSPSDLALVCGDDLSPSVRLDLLRSFASSCSITMRQLKSGWVSLHWPKVAETQGWGHPGRARGNPGQRPRNARAIPPSGLRPPASYPDPDSSSESPEVRSTASSPTRGGGPQDAEGRSRAREPEPGNGPDPEAKPKPLDPVLASAQHRLDQRRKAIAAAEAETPSDFTRISDALGPNRRST
jgi:hypothetical protein